MLISDPRRQRRRSLCCACRARRREPVLFHSSCPPQLSRAGYHPRDPRWAAAARSDSREAPRSLTSAACLARSEDRARFRLSAIRTQKPPLSLGCPHHRRCGTGIWPDRDITARRPDVAASCASLPTVPLAPTRTPAENRGFSTWEGEFPRETGSHVTRRWRETDSNPRSPVRLHPMAPLLDAPPATPPGPASTSTLAIARLLHGASGR